VVGGGVRGLDLDRTPELALGGGRIGVVEHRREGQSGVRLGQPFVDLQSTAGRHLRPRRIIEKVVSIRQSRPSQRELGIALHRRAVVLGGLLKIRDGSPIPVMPSLQVRLPGRG
jgi:hypothetical protein